MIPLPSAFQPQPLPRLGKLVTKSKSFVELLQEHLEDLTLMEELEQMHHPIDFDNPFHARPTVTYHHDEYGREQGVQMYKMGDHYLYMTIKNSKFHGPAINYYASGNVHSTSTWSWGQTHGELIVYNEDGSIETHLMKAYGNTTETIVDNR